MSYKDELYKAYVNTHIRHRKKAGDLDDFAQRARAYQRTFGAFIPSDKAAKIMDLGCGPGSIVWWLRDRGYGNVAGIDISQEQVNVARDLGLDSVVQGDIFDFLRMEGAEYDVLFARDVLEHLDKEAAYQFVKLSQARLKTGGRLILQVPNAESPYFGRVRYGDFTHELAFTASSITQLLGAVGFQRIEVHPWRPAITGLRSLMRYFAWRLIEPILKMPIYVESGRSNGIVTMNLIAIAKKLDTNK